MLHIVAIYSIQYIAKRYILLKGKYSGRASFTHMINIVHVNCGKKLFFIFLPPGVQNSISGSNFCTLLSTTHDLCILHRWTLFDLPMYNLQSLWVHPRPGCAQRDCRLYTAEALGCTVKSAKFGPKIECWTPGGKQMKNNVFPHLTVTIFIIWVRLARPLYLPFKNQIWVRSDQ